MDSASGKSSLQHDSELAALRDGERAATEKFVRENAPWMLALARRILRDNAHAEDAVQSAFANIFKNLNRFEERSSIKTWMHRIVVNQALMILRKNGQAQETSIEDLLPSFDDNGCRIVENLTTFETPELLMQRTEVREKIAELVNLLPDNYRIVLVLRDIEELSTAETAEILELSESNVKVRLHRARSALKTLLEPLVRRQEL